MISAIYPGFFSWIRIKHISYMCLPCTSFYWISILDKDPYMRICLVLAWYTSLAVTLPMIRVPERVSNVSPILWHMFLHLFSSAVLAYTIGVGLPASALLGPGLVQLASLGCPSELCFMLALYSAFLTWTVQWMQEHMIQHFGRKSKCRLNHAMMI